MKSATKTILTAIAMLFAFNLNAQVSYGPVLGINFADIAGDGSSDNAMKIGAHVGAAINFEITETFFIETGLLYSMKGTQYAEDSDEKIKLAYLDIPILAKYQMASGFNMFAGPYIGILLSADYTDGDENVDVKEAFSSTDIGLKLGLGYQLASGFGFSGHYGVGLTNLLSDGEGFSMNNAVLGISLYYMLSDSKPMAK